MKSKCSFILKASTALVLALLMLFGTVATSVAAVVDNAKNTAEADAAESEAHGAEGFFAALRRNTPDLADTGKKADLAETGYTINGGKVYFDASGLTVNHLQIAIVGTDTNDWNRDCVHFEEMTLVSGTDNLYYKQVNGIGSKMNNPWGIIIFDANTVWGDYNDSTCNDLSGIKNNIDTNSNWNSSKNQYGTDLSSGNTYFITHSSNTDGFGLTVGTSVPSSLSYNQTAKVSIKAVGASSYTTKTSSNTSTGGTLKITGKVWSSKAVADSSTTASNYSAAMNSAVKSSYAKLTTTTYSGYTFDGWYSTNTGTGTQYTTTTGYKVTGATTTYGRYSENANTVTFTKKLGSSAATNITTKSAGVTTKASYTAPDESGYTFTGWEITSGSANATNVTGTGSASSTTVSLNATGAVTVQATYEQSGVPSLDSIGNVSKTVNDTTFNVTANISDEDKKTGTLSATVSSGTTSVATVGSATVSGSTVTIPVTVKGPGSSTITVTLKDGSTEMNSQTFTVEVATPTFSLTGKTIYANDKDVAACAVTDGGTTPTSIAWTTTNSANVAVNSSTGTLTAKKINSNATIAATATYACGYTKTASGVTVTVANPTLTIQSSATSGKIGDTATASVKTSSNPTVSSTTVASYLWSTSDTTIIGISDTSAASPTLTFKKAGTATIKLKVTYKNNSLYKESATVSITVSDASITFTTTGQTVNVGSTYRRTATGSTIGSAATGTISYSSGTESVATVNSSGVVTALTPGTSQITATYTVTCGGQTTTKSKNYTVTVPTPSITQDNVTIAKGDSKTLSTATTNPDSGLTVTFALSGTPNGVTCTSAGKVTVAQNSTASSATVVATATNSGGTTVATKNITVTIESPSMPVKDGSTTLMNGDNIYTTIGTDKSLTVTPNFADDITVKSSKTSIATVSISGTGNNRTITIHPVAKGKTTLSVSTNSGYAPTGVNLTETAAAMPQGFIRRITELAATAAVAEQTQTFTVNVAEAESGHVVYLTDNAGWGSAVIHSWGTDGSGAITDHAAMTKVGVNNSNQDVYAYRFTDAQWTQVQHIRFLKSSSTTWDGNADQTVTITSFTSNAWYTTNSNSPRGVDTWNCSLQKPQITANNVTIDMGGTETMTATVLTSQTPSTFNWSSGDTSKATTADTHTASNVITGVAPGTSTITIKAYANKTTDFKSIVTDGSADDFVAGTTTATATVVAENKTVTFGAQKTDDGSTFTDVTGAVTAKYYDEDTSSGSGSSGSGSSGSGSSGSGTGAGKYMWYNTNNSKDLSTATSAGEMISLGDGTCYGSFTCAAGQNYDIVINNTNTKGSCLTSSTTVTGNQTWAKVENNGDTYWALDSYSAAVPIYVIYNPTANSVRFTTTNPASSGSSGSGSSGSGSGSSGSGTGYTGEGTTMTSPQSVPYGKVAVFTAEATKTVGSVTYYFAEWVDENGDTISTDNPYTVKVTANQSVYARYYKVFKLSAFDSYTSDGTNVTFVTAPPKLITVKHGDDTYIYSYSGTAATGNPNSPDGDKVAALAIGGGTYGQGNYIQYYAGDEITLYYTSMASSEIFKGVFYNNSANYYVAKPSAAQYVAHDYSAGKTLYMNSNYYNSVPSGLPSTTVDHDNHSIKFTGNQDFKNIDIEIATKRKVYFSDYTNAIIGSKNTDDYYYDGEALSVTGDQLTVKAAGSATQTNSITASNVKFYRADANGQPTGSALSGFTVAYNSGSDAVTNSGTTASTRYIIISGNMPSYDLYIDLGMTNSYTIKLGSKVVSDSLASKTRLAEVATVTIKEGSTTKLTAPNNADVTSKSYSAPTATALTLTTAYTGSWDDYYTFVGWYWGDDTAPDYAKGFISDKLTLNYTPKKGGTIWAVGTRSLYINGSKYITGKDTNWYGENNTQKNLEMSFDAESGRYYWEITDTMFAAAGYNYKTWKVDSWTEKHTDYGVYAYSDAYYWTDNDDKYHGKSFFQILDKESGSTDKSVWDSITSFREDTPANGPTYGKIYPRDYDDDYSKKHDGQGFINFNETDYAGQSSPLRIYFNPSATGNARLTVESTKIYSNLYVSDGFTVGSTLRTSAVTVQPVVDGVVKTSGQTGYFSVNKQGNGWDPDVEGHVNHYKPQKKGATVRITKTAGGSDKIVAFFIYDITNKTVRAERDVKNSGSNYYIDLTLANEEQNLYIVPIVEEAGANVTISFDATQLNRKQWGDIVTAYAWYSGTGGNALGGYPGQPMIPSDDMTTWTTTFKGTNSNDEELQGITFSNYVDGIHSWLGCSGVMGTVTYGGSGTQASPTTVSIADDGIIKQYNYIESGSYKEYSRANFKAQTYDYREPIALYDRFKSEDHVSISFSMKDGNSSLISWRHQDLTSGDNILNPSSEAWRLNFEYLTNAKGDKYIDMNGNTMKTKPTASFYVAAKGLVLYGNSSMTNVFYSGKQYDDVSGVTYGGASGIGMNYAVQWYVYDAQGNYITNVLTAGIADLASNNVDSYIGKRLEDMGYAVDGKSVAICYDKPRYMYGDSDFASSDQAAGYNGKGINCGANFDAYRFTGQWNAVASNELVNVKVGVGMMTDSGEVLASSNTAGYGNASASYDTTKGNNTRVTDEDGNDAPFTASDGSFVRTAVRDASNSPVKLNASAQNFIGWYYYDANTGDFVKANYASNENFYPNYSNKDVTFYAMYRASAIYQYKYVGREGERTYSAAGEDLTADELANNSRIDAASHEADIKIKVPVDIGIFKKTIDFSPTNYASWTKTPDNNGYILDITGFTTGIPEYTLTAHYKDANNEEQIISVSAAYNAIAVDLTTKNGGSPVTSLYGKRFLGWYEYKGEGQTGDLLSTQANYGLRLTDYTDIIAVYDEDGSTTRPEDSESWKVAIDENIVNKELTTKDTGVYYNDTIVRVRNGSNVKASLPSGAKIGVLVVCDNKTGTAIDYDNTKLESLANAIASGKTMKAKSGLSITNMQANEQTNFNRTDIAVRSVYEKNLGAKYRVYAYLKVGDTYYFSAPSDVKMYN